MYYVITKTTPAAVLQTSFKREDARHFAKANDATVKTQAELDTLLAAGKIDRRTMPGYVAPERIEALATATEEKVEATVAAGVATSILDMAKQIANNAKTRVTIGAKKAKAKTARVETPVAVLTEAQAFVGTLGELNKVDTVRELARWVAADGTKLQRRDALSLLHDIVNPATVSTQWQLVRSGKLDTPTAAE